MPWHRHTSDTHTATTAAPQEHSVPPNPSPNFCCSQPQWEEAELHRDAVSITTTYGTVNSSPLH